MTGKRFRFTQFRSLRRARLLVAVMLPALLVGVTPAGAAGPTDNQVPMVSSVTKPPGEIGPGDQVAAVVKGRFATAPLGTTPIVTAVGDPAVSFSVLEWDDDQIFGTLSLGPSTVLGQKTIKVQQDVGGQASEATKASAFRVGFTPVITGVNPATMVADDGATVTISGDKFEGAATVTLTGPGGVTASPTSTTVAAGGQSITAVFAADSDLRLGAWTLTVANPGAGTSATFAPLQITGAAPSVESVSVSQIGEGVSNVPVTVSGDAFYNGVSVTFSGGGLTVASLTRVSRTQLQFNLSAASGAEVGPRDITVTNGDGQSVTVASAVEVIEELVVTEGQLFTLPQGVRRRVVTVQGSGLRDDTTVVFTDASGNPTADLWVTSKRSVTGGIRLEVNAAEAAPVDQRLGVRFVNPGGGTDQCEVTTGQSGCIEMTPGPRATSVDPETVVRGEADLLVITGDRFLVAGPNGAAFPFITFSNAGIHIVGSISYMPTSLTVPVEIDSNAPLGDVDVTVVNPDGGRGSCHQCLEVLAAT